MASLLKTFEDQVRPDHTALLVIDIQNDFCAVGGFLERERGYNVDFAKRVAESIGTVVSAARAAGVLVVWIRSIYDFKYLAAPHVAKRGLEGCCLEGTWGAEFFMLQPDPSDPVVSKHHYSAFAGTPLDSILRKNDIKTLIMTGVATNVCVDSTLRDGFFAGYYIVVLEDCVGSNSIPGHNGTLATVRNNIGTVASSADWISRLPRAHSYAAGSVRG